MVGLDIGTSSAKGLRVAEDGSVLATAEEPYPLSTPRPGWSEQDPGDWVRAAERVLERLDARSAAGIGLSGQMHGLVVLDERDRPLRPAMLWNDGRTGAQCAEIEERLSLQRLIELTGNRALTGFTAPKLRWIAEHEPEVLAAVRRVCLPKDHVRLALTGEHLSDVADASGTLWFDVGARRWSPEVLDALEVDPAWLPEVRESPAVAGGWHGVPVAAGAGDQAAGAVGVGVLDEGGPASVVLGTSGVVLAADASFAPDAQARVHAFCHAVPATWQRMGVMLSAAGSLRWLHDAVGRPGFDVLLGEAAAWEPGAEGLTFLPYLSGERTPHADPAARGAFAGLELRHDRGALARAVLEGVAFGLRDCLDLVGEAPFGRVSGGGARGELWLRIVASVLELPLQRVAVDEGAAFGAALLGGVAGGVWSSVGEAVAATVRPGDTIDPDPAWVTAYAEPRARFRALYPALRGNVSST